LDLVRNAEGNVVGVGVVLTEGWEWKNVMGTEDVEFVRELGHIPQFAKEANGKWSAVKGT
jgi:adenine phosphoribosyltransferase